MRQLASIIILLTALLPSTPALSLTAPALSIVMPLPMRVSAKRVRRVRRVHGRCVSVRCTMIQALRITHEPRSWLQPLLWLAWRESRDNPGAVAYESTAMGYAQGLMQMIPTTFQAHALPGMENVWNPLDNSVAAIEYIRWRYRNPMNIPGVMSEGQYEGY